MRPDCIWQHSILDLFAIQPPLVLLPSGAKGFIQLLLKQTEQLPASTILLQFGTSPCFGLASLQLGGITQLTDSCRSKTAIF